MKIQNNVIPNNIIGKKTNPTAKTGQSFNNVIGGLIDQVKSEQNDADKLVQDFVNGGNVEIHDVMIAGEKAKTSLELLLELRNKTLDMYKEITRMQ